MSLGVYVGAELEAALMAAGLVLASCGGPGDGTEEVGTRRDAIHHGEADASDPAVVALVFRRTSCDGAPPIVQCSGTLIADRLVLTAAHCVATQARGVYEVFSGPRPGAPGGVYRGIVKRLVHPLYDPLRDDHDLALVWLDASLPAAPPPLAEVLPAMMAPGNSARVVGFGDVAEGGLGGAKREGTVLVTSAATSTIGYGSSPAMTCHGDSGGPVYIQEGGVESLAAVTTSGDAACEEKGVAVRVDVHLADFIRPAIAAGLPAAVASVALEDVCRASCGDDAECPADLVCRADLDGTNRCLLPDVGAGLFDAACGTDADCSGGACVPIGAACRCQRACVANTPSTTGVGRSTDRAGSGCSVGPRARGNGWQLWLASLVAAVRLAARRRKDWCAECPCGHAPGPAM